MAWPGLRPVAIIAAVGVFLIGDVSFGRLERALEERASLAQRASSIETERRYRIAHTVYHHDLKPLYDGPAMWGPITYTVRTNSLGFKDASTRTVDPVADRSRLLLLGDSFTEGVGVEYELTFAGVLSRELAPAGIEVLNAAVSSYSPAIYWKKTADLLVRRRLRVDGVVIALDLSDIRDEVMFYSIDPGGRVVDADFSLPLTEAWPFNSMAFRLVRKATLPLLARVASADCTPMDGMPGCQGAAPMPERVFERWHCSALATYACWGGWTLSRAALERWAAEGLRTADDHLTRLAAMLRARAIPLTLVVYPWPQQVLWNDWDSVQVRYWRDWAEREHVDFIELFTPFFAEADNLGASQAVNRYFLEDDIHWSVAGHQFVANMLRNRVGGPAPQP